MKTSGAHATEIHYQDVGQGQPVVLIHGWPRSLRSRESQVNALTEAGYRCVSYDRRGFGESGQPAGGYDYDTFASDLQQCIVAFGTTDFREDLKKITVPTIIIHGDSDRIVPFAVSGKRSHEMIKGSRLEVLKGAPHGFAATHAQQLNTLMLDFLRS